MANTQKQPMIFTVQQGRQEVELNETEYKKHMAAMIPKKFKAISKCTTKQVADLLKIARGEDEMDPESPEEWVDALTLITADYDAAIAKLKEAELEAADAAKRADAEANKQVDAEKRIIEIACNTKLSDAMTNVFEKFDMGEGMNQCVPKSGTTVTPEDMATALAFAMNQENYSQWAQGDMVKLLEDEGYENVVVNLSEIFSKGYSTLSGYARVSRAFPPDLRDKALPFTVYRDIGNSRFDEDPDANRKAQQDLLKEAQQKQLNTSEVKQLVKEKTGRDTPASKPRYMEVAGTSITDIMFHESCPAYTPDAIIIDMMKRKYLDKSGEGEFWAEFAS